MGNGQSKSSRTPWLTLLLLTIVAGCLRFYSIDKPSIWGDEAASWYRISGSWQQLVNELRTAGFMPGHYVTLWWIKEGFPYAGKWEEMPARDAIAGRRPAAGNRPSDTYRVWTPTHRLVEGGINPSPLVMRFTPALCGTLMVPAMYFLASRLVARRTALLAAVFACFSCYLLNYSRDSKMYMQLWFFATLHVACLLWWLEAYRIPRRSTGPPTLSDKERELADGVAGVLPSTHIQQVAGAFAPVVPAGAVDVREEISVRLGTFIRFACWLVSGLAMIAFHAVGIGILAIEVLIFLATVPQRLGWMKRLVSRTQDSRPFWTRLSLPPILGFTIGLFAIASLFNHYRDFSRFYDRVEPTEASHTQYDVDGAGIGWVERYNNGRTAADTFLLDATAYLYNWEWVMPSQTKEVDPVTLKRLQWTGIALLVSIGVGVLPLRRLIARITSSPQRFEHGPMPATALLVLATWIAIPAYGFYLASGAWDDAGSRTAAPLANATVASVIFPAATNAPETEALRGTLTTHLKPVAAGTETFSAAKDKLAALPWSKLFTIEQATDAPLRWWTIAALAGGAAIVILSWPTPAVTAPPMPPLIAQDEYESRRRLRTRRRVAWLSSLLLNTCKIVIVGWVLWMLAIVAFAIVPPQEKSVWMPRYMGFVWPAFAIAVCVLIRRIPLLPLRYSVILLLIAANLTVFWARIHHGEPPTARIAIDQAAVINDSNTTRFFSTIMEHPGFGSPGSGVMGTLPNTYYYVTQNRPPLQYTTDPQAAVTPRQARGYLNNFSGLIRGNGFDNALRGTLLRDRRVDDLYAWTVLPNHIEPNDFEQRLRAALPETWSIAEPAERWQVYDHWSWRKLFVIERHHWTRTELAGPPTTRATTRATTQPATRNTRNPSRAPAR